MSRYLSQQNEQDTAQQVSGSEVSSDSELKKFLKGEFQKIGAELSGLK